MVDLGRALSRCPPRIVSPAQVPSDFHLDGVRIPPRVCRLIAPDLMKTLRATVVEFGAVDSEVAMVIRAIYEAGESWRTGADASSERNRREPSPQSEHDQLTTAEIAQELGCTANNVRDLVRRGRLTPSRRRPVVLIDRAELDQYKATCTA